MVSAASIVTVRLVTSLTGFDLAALLHSNNNRFSCLVKSLLSSQVGHQLAVQWYLPLEYSKRVLPKNKVNRFNLESSYTSTLVFPYLNCTLKTIVIIADFFTVSLSIFRYFLLKFCSVQFPLWFFSHLCCSKQNGSKWYFRTRVYERDRLAEWVSALASVWPDDRITCSIFGHLKQIKLANISINFFQSWFKILPKKNQVTL